MIWQYFVFKTTAMKIYNAVLLTCLLTDNNIHTFLKIQRLFTMPKMCTLISGDIMYDYKTCISQPQEITFKTWASMHALKTDKSFFTLTSSSESIGRFHPFYRPRRPFGTSALGGVGVSVTPWPLSTPGKDPVPSVQETGWAPGPVWTGAENLVPTGIRSPNRPPRSQLLYRLS
jgi:hypothetical protein